MHNAARPFVSLFLLAAVAVSAADRKVTLVTGREKNFGDSATIIVPTVILKLPVSGHIFVAKQGSALSAVGGGSPNTVRASARYKVTGLDPALAQSIAAKVYDDFVGHLRAAGYTVKTYADIRDLDPVKRAERLRAGAAGLPTETDRNNTVTWAIATPSAEQAFVEGLSGGVFNQFMSLGKSTLGEGTVLIPTFVITAPQIGGETSASYSTIHAGIKAAPGMNLQAVFVPLLTSRGGWGNANLKAPLVNIGGKVGELKASDATDKAGNDFSKAMSMLSGAGQIKTQSSNYELVIDPAAYTAAVLDGVGAFDTELEKLVASARR